MLRFKAALLQQFFYMPVLLKQFAMTGKAAHSEIVEERIHLVRLSEGIQCRSQQAFACIRAVRIKVQITNNVIAYIRRDVPLLIKSKGRVPY